MGKLRQKIKEVRFQLKIGKRVAADKTFYRTAVLTKKEQQKAPFRSDILNYLMGKTKAKNYLEIGVRNPSENFDKIFCAQKYSVDPGIEFEENPVDFKMTSDLFFQKLEEGSLNIPANIKFDVIFIDGLHLADQVEKDIKNALNHISEQGFIVLHDCNPPSEFHARENYYFRNSPAKGSWNGTTWKAFYKYRHHHELYSICFDTDWGVGVLSKTKYPQFNTIVEPIENPYFEFRVLNSNKKKMMNLTDFNSWKNTFLP